MKIIRDGKEIELTPVELEQAFREKEKEYHKGDILIKIAEMLECGEISKTDFPRNDGVPSDEMMEDMLYWYDKNVDNIDRDEFWEAVRAAVNKVLFDI